MALPVSAEPLTIGAGYGSIDLEDLGFLGFAGMLVNKSSLNSIFTGLKTLFNNALKAESGTWQDTTMEIPSTGEGEDYA